jgi:hypothetical protein
MLLAPHHASKRLPLDVAEVIRHWEGADPVVELVCLFPLALNDVVKLLFVQIRIVPLREAETND